MIWGGLVKNKYKDTWTKSTYNKQRIPKGGDAVLWLTDDGIVLLTLFFRFKEAVNG